MSAARPLAAPAAGGVHHWWVQRVSAVVLVPLGLWLLVSLARRPDLEYGTLRAWLAQPLQALLMALLVCTATYHSWLGVCVVIDDYVPSPATNRAALLAARLLHLALGAGALLAVLRLAFGGAA
jgi:succinate dehydrogenase / fumarate reductase, membrane anchor subunit